MKKTQIDSLYAISFSLLYIFMEQFFFPTDVLRTDMNWCLTALFYCFILHNVKSNNTDPITAWFLSIVRSNFILDGFVNLDGITLPS